MSMKSRLFKTILTSSIALVSHNLFSAEMSDLIQFWKQKGYLILTIPVKFDALQPTSSLNAHTKLSLPLIFEPLVSIGAQQELRPILAKSWSISGDGKSVTIILKQKHFLSKTPREAAFCLGLLKDIPLVQN